MAFTAADPVGTATSPKLPERSIKKHMQMACAIDQRRIGVAVAVEVSPDKLTNPGDPVKRMNREKRAVPIVAQHNRKPTCLPHHNVEIAISLDVNRPCPGVRRVDHWGRQLRGCGHIREAIRCVLSEETNSSPAGKYQIRLEIVVEIKRQNTCRV